MLGQTWGWGSGAGWLGSKLAERSGQLPKGRGKWKGELFWSVGLVGGKGKEQLWVMEAEMWDP